MPTIGPEGLSPKALRIKHLFHLLLGTLHLPWIAIVLFSVHDARMPRPSVHF